MPARTGSRRSKLAAGEADAAYRKAAEALSKARGKAAPTLDKAVNAELKPLKLERAKFSTQIDSGSGGRRAERHRPRRILGADQSRARGRGR